MPGRHGVGIEHRDGVGRITSYNVCYTKLLRSIFRLLVGEAMKARDGYTEPMSWGVGGTPGQAAGRLGLGNQLAAGQVVVDVIGDFATATDGVGRITSYNVCYTKLLRWCCFG